VVQIERELSLDYAADHGAFVYRVESSLNISEKYPRTEVYFDGRDGRFIGFDAATGIALGKTLASWLLALHMATVMGMGYRLVVLLVGLAVALLSVWGVWVWWRKRSKRARGSRAPLAAASSQELVGQPATVAGLMSENPGRARTRVERVTESGPACLPAAVG
jgi:uncharacterized iron-regulated membrane protein